VVLTFHVRCGPGEEVLLVSVMFGHIINTTDIADLTHSYPAERTAPVFHIQIHPKRPKYTQILIILYTHLQLTLRASGLNMEYLYRYLYQ
jgi:hypothetical protein